MKNDKLKFNNVSENSKSSVHFFINQHNNYHQQIYGANVAIDDYYKAIQKHGRTKYHFISNRVLEGNLRRETTEEILNKKNHISLLHEMASDLDAFTFLLREEVSENFPITFTHHSFSHKSLLYNWFLKHLLAQPRKYDALICTSKASRDSIKYLFEYVAEEFNKIHNTNLSFKGRYEIIPLGIDTKIFKPYNQKLAREKNNIEPDSIVLLWFGRFSSFSKADLLPLIVVFKRLLKIHTDKNLLLILASSENSPDTYAYQEFARLNGISNRLIIKKAVSFSERQFMYSAADVFVSPVDNIQETFGLTPIEAMSCGIPQVVSDWNGYKNTVVDGVTGFRIPTTWANVNKDLIKKHLLSNEMNDHLDISGSVAIDIDIMTRNLSKLIASNVLRKKMAEASRKNALNNFDWAKIIIRYENLWKDLIKVSKTEKIKHHSSLKFLKPQYFNTFKNYATHTINEETCFELTESSEYILRTNKNINFPIVSEYIDLKINLLLKILLTLGKNKSSTIDKIKIAAKDYNKELIQKHILWLLKYGYIKTKKNG